MEREANAILLYNATKDHELPESFIEGTKPSVDKYESIISITRKALLGRNEIIKAANLKQTQVNVILSDLVEQGIINEVDGKSKKYFYNPEAPEFDPAGFDLLRSVQREELDRMIEYTHLTTCRMEYLCKYLGDDLPNKCGICDVDKKSYLNISDKDAFKSKLQDFRETFFPLLEVESPKSKIVNGVAASYYGVTIVGAALRHSKYEKGGDFPDWLLKLALKAFRKHFGNTKFDLILFVPPTESGNLVENFAVKISTVLNIPISDKLVKSSPTSPQKVFHSGISKKDNVKDKFIFENPEGIEGKNILLIDDIFDSGYTIKEIGHYLTTIGANTIAPLVIARTVGGDI